MLEATVAKAWGLIPSEFKILSDEDKAYMTALEEVNAEISATDAYILDKKAEQAARDAKKSSGGYPRRKR